MGKYQRQYRIILSADTARGAAAARPKAQIILDVLSSIFNADAVPQPPKRLSHGRELRGVAQKNIEAAAELPVMQYLKPITPANLCAKRIASTAPGRTIA